MTAEEDYERLSRLIGDKVCDNDPIVHMSLLAIREGQPVETTLVNAIRALSADLVLVQDVLMVAKLSVPPGRKWLV